MNQTRRTIETCSVKGRLRASRGKTGSALNAQSPSLNKREKTSAGKRPRLIYVSRPSPDSLLKQNKSPGSGKLKTLPKNRNPEKWTGLKAALEKAKALENEVIRKAAAFIKRFEGFAARRYRCPAGHLTIGYGHVIRPGEHFPESVSPEEAEALLVYDLLYVQQKVRSLVHAPLKGCQEAALLSFAFNVGSTAFYRSTLRQKINRGEYGEAALEFHRWRLAKGRVLPGLVKRRIVEAALFEGAYETT